MAALGRPRRSCLAVPGSSVKMLGKAQGLPADQVFLDLEDAVAPLAKPDARKNVVAALLVVWVVALSMLASGSFGP